MKIYYKTELGKLYHGKCLKVMKNLVKEGVKVDAIICDLPFGTTACTWDEVIPINSMWKVIEKLVHEDTPIILFGNEPFSSKLRMSNIDSYRYDWKWEKNNKTNYLNANKQPLRVIEDILVFYKKQCLFNKQITQGHNLKEVKAISRGKTGEVTNSFKYLDYSSTSRNPINKLVVNSEKYTNSLHPTQKPLELIKYLVETYTNENNTILDFSSGSGTLAYACEQLNRKWLCIEKEKKYCDVTIERLKEVQQTFFK